ncbi:RQC complex ubiquitin-protein ligase E3 Rkr1 [Schizosaccharomyces pombe]|uniref:E3 ubiquitin-protein ligase listerin n=1 Tax=Schizosaccharomyces pombe (strain 972 / ATCC 24843) TaxID=284812 RepID=LTN1_SCHPO|nr:putative ubiquitin-protein ligase E3 [Schizosaccharomyces pombe]O74349.1 RecName: Full=E3 ubiquitin-protein ligase listerin; AltName: Full=RING-type E3 ubiquitin transferase listerin [Schizosaccharomyces pombe 972h-]CAA20765.1 ubiquitin-protein ligase E3 (predicted) [Schizosaccharomyces pombe]|eukprot:NP_596004.1 putative ubiquitin-protein ligase E3 [Schizosaccharomyces pombe]
MKKKSTDLYGRKNPGMQSMSGSFSSLQIALDESSSNFSTIYEPPDLSGLDAEMIVIVKNLQKRDIVTKCRALQDLIQWNDPSQFDNEQFLNALAVLFPRLSIEVERHVRLKIFVFMSVLSSALQKKLAPWLKFYITPWVMGFFDSDRAVSVSAKDSFKNLLSEEKWPHVWLKFGSTIAPIVTDVFLHEDKESLTDLRFFSNEEAESKVTRVKSSCLLTLSFLFKQTADLENLETDKKIDKQTFKSSLYENLSTLFKSDEFWSLVSSPQDGVTVSLSDLLLIILKYDKPFVTQYKEKYFKRVSRMISRLTSLTCVPMLRLLSNMISNFPNEVHQFANDSKRPLSKLFSNLITKRISLPNSGFYTSLLNLFKSIGAMQLVPSIESVDELCDAFLETANQEQRFLSTEVYDCLLNFLSFVYTDSSDPQIKDHVRDRLRTIFTRYFKGEFVLRCSTSDFDHCLQSVFDKNSDFASLWNEVLFGFFNDESMDIETIPFDSLSRNLSLTVQTVLYLKNRNFQTGNEVMSILGPCLSFLMKLSTHKNERIACLSASQLITVCHIFSDTTLIKPVKELFQKYLVNDLPSSILKLGPQSPAFTLLRDILLLLKDYADLSEPWENVANQFTVSFDELENIRVLNSLPSLFADGKLRGKISLVKTLVEYYDTAVFAIMQNPGNDWDMIRACIGSKEILVPEETIKNILFTTLEYFLTNDWVDNHLIILCASLHSLKAHLPTIFDENKSLYSLLPVILFSKPEDDGHVAAHFESIFSLLKEKALEDSGFSLKLCSEVQEWSLNKVLNGSINEKLAADKCVLVFNSFGKLPSNFFTFPASFWDAKISSCIPFFSNKLFIDQDFILGFLDLVASEPINVDMTDVGTQFVHIFHASLYTLYYVETTGCDGDALFNLTFAYLLIRIYLQNGIQSIIDVPIRDAGIFVESFECYFKGEVVKFMRDKDALTVLNELLIDDIDGKMPVLFKRFKNLSSAENTTSFSIFAAQGLTDFLIVVSNLLEMDEKHVDVVLGKLGLSSSKSPIFVSSILEGLKPLEVDSEIIQRIRFKAVNDLTGKLHSANEVSKSLLILNAATTQQITEKPLLPITRCRLFLENITNWCSESGIKSLELLPVCCFLRFMYYFLPTVFSLSGSYWNSIFDYIKYAMKMSVVDAPIVKSFELFALRLYNALSKNYEMNSDIKDCIVESNESMNYLLLKRFLFTHESTLRNSVTARMCNQYLVKLLENCPGKVVRSFQYQEFFPSLCNSNDLQMESVCMKFLREKLSHELKELTVYYMVESDYEPDVSLCPELLSLAIDFPGDPFVMVSKMEKYEHALRVYLLVWDLIFYHFEETTYNIKLSIINQLHAMDLLRPLLNTLVEILNLSYDRPINVDKYPKIDYNLMDYSSATDRIRCLAIHIYYQCLRHLSSSVRSYWSEVKNRAFTSTVESFTGYNVSPLLISASLDDVERSIESEDFQSVGDVNVKVNRNTREISFIYNVDEHKLEMAIKIPSVYPLQNVQVEGIERVGVNERQWRSWILASQSILSSQNGSITDALLVLKKNISMHFEGVEECAICYSVLSVERTLPNKRCGTCRHKFHASCLYKWFKSSNSSRCPLCRSSFTFV